MKPICALLIAATASGCVAVRDQNGGSRFIQSSSPTAMGQAIFTKEIGMQDTAIIFEVSDPKISAKPINIGFVGDAHWKGQPPRAAVWSKDGSVIAVQDAESKNWSHAYDFRTSHNFADVYPDAKRAAAIEKLLKIRGGLGPKVLNDWKQFDKVAVPVEQNAR